MFKMAALAEKDVCIESVARNEITNVTFNKVSALKEDVSEENGFDHDGNAWKNFPGNIIGDGQESSSTWSISVNGSKLDQIGRLGSIETVGKNKDISEEIDAIAENMTCVQTNFDSPCKDSSDISVMANSHFVNSSSDSADGLEVEDCEDADSNVVISSPVKDCLSAPVANNSATLVNSARDSLSSHHSSNFDKTAQTNDKDLLVGTVKDDEGVDILIALNEEDAEKGEVDGKSNKGIYFPEINNKEQNDINVKHIKTEIDLTDKQMSQAVSPGNGMAHVIHKKLPVGVLPDMTVNKSIVNTNLSALLVKSGVTIPGLPSEAQLLRQRNKYGYVANVGSQNLFVPVSIPVSVAGAPKTNHNQIMSNAYTEHLKTFYQPLITPVQPQAKTTNLTAEFMHPKSSWELMELMRWEIQNRIPDSYNWSIVFPTRKEVLSSITMFLQELGSDLVKEQVYKDIIQIQTKKKESGELRDAEIDSLEKMKIVFDNTKKKVEHLHLDTITCVEPECDFKTESSLIMDYHKDFPHYIPPWDRNKGWMTCSRCDFKTKMFTQFVSHTDSVHKVQAKFLEKERYFPCHLCQYNAASKGKLVRHQPKCSKNFKLNINLQPYYHDVNFCMKSCFYKPQKPVIKVPTRTIPPPPKLQPHPTMQTKHTNVVIHPPHQHHMPNYIRPPRTTSQAPVIYGQVQQTPVRQALQQFAQQNVAFNSIQIMPDPPRPVVNAAQLRTLSPAPPAPKTIRPPGQEMAGFEVCELCGGYVKDRQALRIHFYYAHKVDLSLAIFNRPNAPLICDVCKSHFWTTQGLTKHKTTHRHFSSLHSVTSGIGSNQQCFICARKVSNLFVHIEQVHGKTMKDLLLTRKCIMCGLTAADHKSLELHMASAHGVLIKASDYVDQFQSDLQIKAPTVNPIILDNAKDGKLLGKINFCVFCEIQFPDNVQLTMHCIKIHAMCNICGMVMASNNLLKAHSCKQTQRSCYICGLNNMTPEKYAEHLGEHVKPCEVKLRKMSELEIDDIKEKIKREYKPAVISLDSDDSDVEVIETKPSQIKVVLEKNDSRHTETSDGKTDMHIAVGRGKQNVKGTDEIENITLNLQHQNDISQEKCSISDAIVLEMKHNKNIANDSKCSGDSNNVNASSNKSMIDNKLGSKSDIVCATNIVIKEVTESEKEIKFHGTEIKVDKHLQKSDNEDTRCVECHKRKRCDSDTDEENPGLMKRSRLGIL